MPFATPSRHVRCRRPSAVESGPSRNSASATAGSIRRPCASAASISPFHDAIALSSRAGCGRSLRCASSRARVAAVELAAQHEATVLEREQKLVGRAFAGRPAERQSFDAVRVRVLRRGEAAAG